MPSESWMHNHLESPYADRISSGVYYRYSDLSSVRGESKLMMLLAAKPIAEIFVLGVVAGFNWAKQMRDY